MECINRNLILFMKGLRSLISETFFGSAINVAGVGVICFFHLIGWLMLVVLTKCRKVFYYGLTRDS